MTSPARRKIALIHATPLAMAPVNEAFARLWSDAQLANLLDDSLSSDLAAAGRLDEAMYTRFSTLGRYVTSAGADAILFTCSAFGPAIEQVASEHAPVPVLKPNEAMFAAAICAGGTVGMVATFPPSIPSMAREFEAMASTAETPVRLKCVCADGAMEALARGDGASHDALVAKAARDLDGCNAIMLAQFSMARAKSAVAAEAEGVSVLTSPDSAVQQLRRALA